MAVILLGFVLVTTGIIWRRGNGIARAGVIREMDRRRVQLEGQRASLERQIADLSGRAHLGPIVERRLNMRVPDDSQVIVLPGPPVDLPPAAAGDSDTHVTH